MSTIIPSRESDMGELAAHGYHLSKGTTARHQDLGKAIQELGALHVWHEVHALAIRQRGNKMHRGYVKRALADERWISRTHLGKGRR